MRPMGQSEFKSGLIIKKKFGFLNYDVQELAKNKL
jgi:hypothetical protein